MQDQPLSEAARWQEYAAREAEHPELGAFEGGAPPNNLWIGLGIVCVLVLLYYWLFVDPNKVNPGP